ncbi:efflux RND transporter periplasmic adaptor subunit [Ensifer sp. B1-9]|uniref:efflux RND transporter periplasmic adaptor subunit n=1 Tax=Ensifer sp. B1-9 TaxID=3141455 RepID=UPI003D1C907B
MGTLPHAAAACCIIACLALSSTSLTACSDETALEHPPQMVRAIAVELADHTQTVTLTGEIRPQVESVQAFRVGGRVVGRVVDTGDHVEVGQLLASLDPDELQTSVSSAEAAVDAAKAQHSQAASAFARQQALLASGFTTRRAYDQADEAMRTSRAVLDQAVAKLDAARDQLTHAELRAAIAGIVTARNVEAGQVVQAAQPMFTIAGDGPRDAVFSVNESIFSREPEEPSVAIALVSDRGVRTRGTLREVSPALSAAGTMIVKVGLANPPAQMELGAAVSGIAKFRSGKVIMLPWQSLASSGGKPAVWIADPTSKAVSLRPVTVDRYDAGQVIIRNGLAPGEIVVTAGSQLLRPGQLVEFADGVKS